MTQKFTKIGNRQFSFSDMALDALTARDLREDASEPDAKAYSITIYDETGTKPEASGAEALHLPSEGRTGIAWGGNATWFDTLDSTNIETDIDFWLNGDPDEVEARN